MRQASLERIKRGNYGLWVSGADSGSSVLYNKEVRRPIIYLTGVSRELYSNR